MLGELKGVKVWTVNKKAEAYLESSWTSMMELYCENNNQLRAIFLKSAIIDFRMGSKYASQKIGIFKMKVRLGK